MRTSVFGIQNLALVTLTTLGVACAREPLGPDAASPIVADIAPGDTFRLAPAQAATLAEAELTVQFVGVTSDSRCPVDAMCVWEGDAAVVAHTRRAGVERVWLLHIPTDRIGPRRVEVGGGWILELTGLDPEPRSGRPIRSADYRAGFRVTSG